MGRNTHPRIRSISTKVNTLPNLTSPKHKPSNLLWKLTHPASLPPINIIPQTHSNTSTTQPSPTYIRCLKQSHPKHSWNSTKHQPLPIRSRVWRIDSEWRRDLWNNWTLSRWIIKIFLLGRCRDLSHSSRSHHRVLLHVQCINHPIIILRISNHSSVLVQRGLRWCSLKWHKKGIHRISLF